MKENDSKSNALSDLILIKPNFACLNEQKGDVFFNQLGKDELTNMAASEYGCRSFYNKIIKVS